MPIFRYIIISVCLTFSIRFVAYSSNSNINTNIDYGTAIEELLKKDEVDYLDIKLTIDSLIDPSTDTDSTRKKIFTMVVDIEKMIPEKASDWDKVQILRKYIYDAGEWNNHNPFSYDLEDPLGNSKTSRLLHNYLNYRKGNCVSMPILHAILGQKIGLDMTISTAPLHMFVRYRNGEGNSINIEATSGGHPSRAVWYQKNLPMTPKAISNGMFMKDLNTKEAIAVIGHDLANHLMREGPYDQAILVSEKLIKQYPKYGPLFLTRGSAFQKYIEAEFQSKYPNQEDVPAKRKGELQSLLRQNAISFQIAEDLGWVHPDVLAKELETKVSK